MGQSLQGYINLIVKHGEQNRKQSKLNPSTEYAVWCYGIDNSGSYPERTTSIARETFTTDAPTVTDNGITLEVEVTGNTFSAVATPYTNDKYYNLKIVALPMEPLLKDASNLNTIICPNISHLCL